MFAIIFAGFFFLSRIKDRTSDSLVNSEYSQKESEVHDGHHHQGHYDQQGHQDHNDEELTKAIKQGVREVGEDEPLDYFKLYENEKAIDELNPLELAKKLEEFRKQIPTKKDLKELSEEEVHRMPLIVKKSSHTLADLKYLISKRDDLKDVALNFYEKCALDKKYETTSKSLCLLNFIKIKQERGEEVELSRFDPELIKMVEFIMN